MVGDKPRRFIAGAVCPQCQLVDKIVLYKKADQEFAECVRCGYLLSQETGKAAKKLAAIPVVVKSERKE